MKELLKMFPEKIEVKLGDKVVEIKTIPFGKLPQIADLADKIMNKVQKNPSNDLGITKAVFEIMKEDFEGVVKGLEITTTLDAKEINEMSLEAATFILSNVIEVNADFLSQKVFPQLKIMSESMAKKK
jgi:hypothetical protein